MLHTSEAIILEVRDLADADRIVTFLSRDQGRKRGVARGARRKYSRFAGQLQPLATVQVTWYEKEGRELVRISSIELLRAAAHLQGDLEGMLLGGYLADHMIEFAQESELNDRLYRLLDSTLSALEQGGDRDLAARYYEAWTLRLAGIYPAPVECPTCGRALAGRETRLAADSGALLCGACAPPGSPRVSRQAAAFLRRIQTESLAALGRRPPSPGTLAEVEAVNARARRIFLQHELKSYRVLHDTLASLPEA